MESCYREAFSDREKSFSCEDLQRRNLLWACGYASEKIAVSLVEHPAYAQSVNVADQSRCTPLILACLRGFSELAILLIQKGADISARNLDKYSPIHIASMKGLSDVVIALLEKGADTELREASNRTPLHWACHNGHFETALILLSKGADINSRDLYRDTPLHWACVQGHSQIALCLIGKGADVDASDWNKNCPLHFACSSCSSLVALALISRVNNVNTRNKYLRTPLHVACQYKKFEIAQALIEKGADVNVKGQYLITPLHWACRNGDKSTAMALIAEGGNIHSMDLDRRSPLDLCPHSIMKFNLDKTFNRLWRTTPLMQALYDHDVPRFEDLLRNTENLDVEERMSDFDSWTIVHVAAYFNRVEYMELLLQHCRINLCFAEESTGYTALHLACARGNLEIINIIFRYTAQHVQCDSITASTDAST